MKSKCSTENERKHATSATRKSEVTTYEEEEKNKKKKKREREREPTWQASAERN
jgi:hypothetical protein